MFTFSGALLSLILLVAHVDTFCTWGRAVAALHTSYPLIMEHQMENALEHDIETEVVQGLGARASKQN